jgi:allantoate deiminase/N-carbamoyl-L-amino-acid hydrolase
MIPLKTLNDLPAREFVGALSSLFEHSPWVPERAAALRPFASNIALHHALCEAVIRADEAQQLALIRAHPELAGRAAIRGDLTPASTSEQKGAGLSACTREQFDRLHSLNAAYNARFGFPFVLAVKGHTPDTVIATLAERVTHHPDQERGVALREIFRIALFRLADLVEESWGTAIMAMADDLSRFSEDKQALTCSYLSPAHRATADRIRDFMLAAGLNVHRDAIGNVVGVLPGNRPTAKRLLTGSHYDTVTNAGRYDGRLGILIPVAVAGALRRAGVTLPYTLEIIAFAEEEGVRFKSTFLGSRAVAGRFDSQVLESLDAQGVSLGEAIRAGGGRVEDIPAIARDPAQTAGFVEIHIEQGPVLLDAGLPVGVVTSIAGNIRSTVTVSGLAGHAGTVPMALRHDAAAAAAEIVLAVERRCSTDPDLVGTVGMLEVPGGAINVIPGRCHLSIDIRSGSDALRDTAVADISAEIERIAHRRGVAIDQRRVLEVASVPCDLALQDAWAGSVRRVTGSSALRLPSGAGHDAMMMAGLTPIGMLFVRCGNGGISHHPSETLSAEDAGLAARVFEDFLRHFEVPA